jgi:replicative DNA helicase
MRAEQAVLGALLANNKAYKFVVGILQKEYFADPIHSLIYNAIVRRCEANQIADAITLGEEFKRSGALDEVGGHTYLAQLLSAMVGITSAGELATAIRDTWLRRHLIDFGESVLNRAFDAESKLDAMQQVEAAKQILWNLGRAFDD